jgi:ribulose-bisphosphate carboxylase small chain
MRITQGTFSFLPELTDEQIVKQISYALDHDWPISIEYTDDPHPRNAFWEMWGLPMFDVHDAGAILEELKRARAGFPPRSSGRQRPAPTVYHRLLRGGASAG